MRRKIAVVHRHGDRSTGVNFFAQTPDAARERRFWEAKVFPYTSHIAATTTTTTTAASYPLVGVRPTLHDAVFGHLTHKGVEEMRALGAACRHLASDSSADLAKVPVYARSTAYIRTVESCRAFLAGLGRLDANSNPVPIHVKELERDGLAAWRSSPELARLIYDFHDSSECRAREKDMAEVKRVLSARLPGLVLSDAPFEWIWAADFFLCREHHLGETSAVEHDFIASTYEELLPYRQRTLEMLKHQYFGYYSLTKGDAARHRTDLASHPLLSGIAEFFDEERTEREAANIVTEHETGSAIRITPSHASLAVFSVHDVVLIPMLVRLGVFSSSGGGDAVESASLEEIWPAYASCIRFVRDLDTNGVTIDYFPGFPASPPREPVTFRKLAHFASVREFREAVTV